MSGQPDKRSADLEQDLASFLLTRGPYSWLGWGWKGCSKQYYFPPEFNLDYGTPTLPSYPTLPSRRPCPVPPPAPMSSPPGGRHVLNALSSARVE